MCMAAPKLSTPAPVFNPPAPLVPPTTADYLAPNTKADGPAAAAPTVQPRRNLLRTDTGAVDSVSTGLNIPS